MLELRVYTLAALALSAAGCGSSGVGRESEATSLLRATNAAELEASLKAGFVAERTPALLADAAFGLAPTSGSPSGDYTATYTQEPEVDEFDAVRYDGSHLYVAPQRYMTCCFIMSAVPGGDSSTKTRAIRVLATDPANATASAVSEIPLPDNVSVQGMYLANGSMFALTSEAFYGSYGPFWTSIAIWAPQKHGFRIYDVRDPAAPTLRLEASIDGVFVDSRRVGNTIYIVSRYTPSVDGLDYAADTPEERAQNDATLSGLSLGELLPKIVINGVSRSLVDPRRCYVANDADDPGYPVITSVTAVPLDDPSAFTTTCYNEDAYGVYVSASALYLTELRADAAGERSFTRIHKFALDGSALSYRGSAEIDGHVWRGGQADFRLSEHEGDLRAFATKSDWNTDDFVDHELYVLREQPQTRQLRIVSRLPNDRRPEEIGKPNEQLFGVRFFGERAYAVTFRRIDPLYVIDLADPADPRLAGQLEVMGVSDFLHPVSDELLLGLGAAEQGGIKLELFDVSDLARPLSRGSSTLGGPGSSSEARYDRHAFTYQADVAGVDRFTIPGTLYSETQSYQFVESGLYFYEIRDKANPLLATLRPSGALITDRAGDPSPAPHAGRNRAFIHDDAVYYVRDEEVWSALWNAPSIPNGPF